jgi:hypothetical protein
VHQSRDEALQQLALAEHDHGLVADARRDRIAAGDRFARADEADEEEGAAREEAAGDGDQGGEAERAGEDGYERLAFRSSALIAGTISCRSPITA